MNEVVSPCVSVCKLSKETGFCEGCWRTREEIAGWRSMDSAQRLQVLDRLHERRADAGLFSRRANRRRRKTA